jgi:hypothetical protein
MDPQERELALRLIALYDVHYQRIFMAAQRKGREQELRRDVAALFSGSTGLAELFRGFQFQSDGTLPPDDVLRNLDGICSFRRLELLYQGLSELLDFLLFSAMESLNRRDEQALQARASAILAEAARAEGGGMVELHSHVMGPGGPTRMVFEPGDPQGSSFEDPAFGELLGPRSAQRGDPDPMSPSERTHAFIPYLPDAAAYELASGFRTCRTEAAFACERAQQIAQLAGDSRELREAALRAAEHAASVIRALDQLDQLVQRLRRR